MVLLQIEISHYQSAAVWGEEQPLAQCEVPLSSSSSRRQRLLFASARVPAAPVLGHSKAHSFAPRLPSHPVCLNLSVKLPLGFGGDFRRPTLRTGHRDEPWKIFPPPPFCSFCLQRLKPICRFPFGLSEKKKEKKML